jgi:hypothetical protein
MPLPEPTSLSLQQSVRLIAKRLRKSVRRVRESLIAAALEGTISATGCPHASAVPGEPEYFAARLNPRTDVRPEAWGGEICWRISRVGLYSLVRIDQAEIERWLAKAGERVERKVATVAPRESTTDDAEQWLRPADAARMVARIRRVSIGAALPILREAMASGEVRVRSVAGGEPEYLSENLWAEAEFDLDKNIVIGATQWALAHSLNEQHPYEAIQISGDDLRHWLRQNTPPSMTTAPTAAGAVDPHQKARGGSTARPFWAPARHVAMTWLADEGCPAPGDGQQAILEDHIAQWLHDRGHQAGESTIRRHVTQWIAERRRELGA